MVIIIILILLLFFVLLFVSSSLSGIKSKGDYDFKVSKKFIEKHNPKIGEEVVFWLNSNEDKISVFLKGTAGADGRIGYIETASLINQIKKDVSFTGIISKIENNTIEIKITYD
jgi:hypothetical protein